METGRDGAQRPTSRTLAGDPFAGIVRRCAAWLIDVVAVTALVFVGISLVGEVAGPTVTFHPEAATLPDTIAADIGRVFVDAVVGTTLSAAYFVIPWSVLGGSPGQLALRIQVRRETGGTRLSVGRATARWILLFPPVATVSVLAAGVDLLGWLLWGGVAVWYAVLLLTTAMSGSKQGLHDRLAQSVVCKRRPAAG